MVAGLQEIQQDGVEQVMGANKIGLVGLGCVSWEGDNAQVFLLGFAHHFRDHLALDSCGDTGFSLLLLFALCVADEERCVTGLSANACFDVDANTAATSVGSNCVHFRLFSGHLCQTIYEL